MSVCMYVYDMCVSMHIYISSYFTVREKNKCIIGWGLRRVDKLNTLDPEDWELIML